MINRTVLKAEAREHLINDILAMVRDSIHEAEHYRKGHALKRCEDGIQSFDVVIEAAIEIEAALKMLFGRI